MFIKLYVLEPQIKETFKAKLLPGYFLNWKICENGLIYYEIKLLLWEIYFKEKIASNLAEILHLDLTTCKVEDFAEFYSDFEFEVNCDCKITAIGKDNFWNYLSFSVLLLERTYKPHYQNFSPLANGTDLNRQKYAILQTHWH